MACGPELRRTRFAPSPTGLLHLGHAYAALVAASRASPGEFLLRIEDIDAARCRPEFEMAIHEDLAWLGLDWQRPVLRQSERRAAYGAALNQLISLGVCYPCRCSRGDIRAVLSAPQEGAPLAGPDGLIYPGTCRGRGMHEAGPGDAIRLDMGCALRLLGAAPMGFTETGPVHRGVHRLDEERLITHVGDVVLSRPAIGTSYHLAVVVDDAAQAITEVTRGEDLFEATQIHVVLQNLLELCTPSYHHHTLIRDETGKRLAKRDDSRAIRYFREAGETPADIRMRIGL